jgi:two-component system OmpR family response regulator
MARILVVEDDPPTAAAISAALKDDGFEVEAAVTGDEALTRASAAPFSAIVLDRMLPGNVDGLEVLATLRSRGDACPVLILSALSAVDERVRGLRAGGDDYLTKPFESLELTARIEVLLRQAAGEERRTRLKVGDLEIDLITRQVCRGARRIELLPREYLLLEYLMRHAGQMITRTMLFEQVWQYRYEPRTNVIDVHMGKLRRKLDEGGCAPMIRTVRGSGYVLRAAE